MIWRISLIGGQVMPALNPEVGPIEQSPSVQPDAPKPPIRRLPFHYAPTSIFHRGRIYHIPPARAATLVREVFLHETAGYLSFRHADGHQFYHYHGNCFGSLAFNTYLIHNDDQYFESFRNSAEEMLQQINGGSLYNPNPYDLPDYATLRQEAVAFGSHGDWGAHSRQAIRPTGTLYTRQQQLTDLQVPLGAAVVGCGGVGSWVAMQLRLVGVPRIYLSDPDTLEEHNGNRLPISRVALSHREPKAAALRKVLRSLGPRPNPDSVQCLEDVGILQGHNLLLFDCTDDLEAQRGYYELCQARGWQYRRVGYSGGYHVTTTTHRAPQWDTPPDNAAQDAYVEPAWVGGAMLAASLGVIAALTVSIQNTREVSVDVREVIQRMVGL